MASVRQWLFRYRYDGAEYSMTVPAESADEARERVKVMSLAQFDGELIARIPASLGVIARAAVAIRNLLRG